MLSFKSFITEKVLSIGLNPEHEKFRTNHRDQIHSIIHKSYKDIGGYGAINQDQTKNILQFTMI